MSWVAILCPAGTVTEARIFSLMISVPAGSSTLAITTSSAALRRMVRSAACSIFGLLGGPRLAKGEDRAAPYQFKPSFYARATALGEEPFRATVASVRRASIALPCRLRGIGQKIVPIPPMNPRLLVLCFGNFIIG